VAVCQLLAQLLDWGTWPWKKSAKREAFAVIHWRRLSRDQNCLSGKRKAKKKKAWRAIRRTV
jgi:hypothetical protein